MIPRELKSDDIEVFSESVAAYFEMTTHDKAQVRSAYLLDSGEPVIWNEYNGVINISGAFQGSICFSSPRGLLTQVLLRIGESNYSDAFHRDVVGEIANTMSGRARKHFGENMEISPPRAFPGKTENIARTAKSSPYVIPFKWHGYEAHLVVNMDVVV